MEQKHLGIKISKVEKEALDFISQRSHVTRSKLLYPEMRKIICRDLGVALMYLLGYSKKSDLEDMKRLLLFTDLKKESIHLYKLPPSIHTFLRILSEKKVWKRFENLFDDIKFKKIHPQEELEHVIELDILDIAEHLGTRYTELSGSLESIDMKLSKKILFERVLWDIYFHLSVSPARETEKQWYLGRSKVRSFQKTLVNRYDKIMQKKPVEVVEVMGRKQKSENGKERKRRKEKRKKR